MTLEVPLSHSLERSAGSLAMCKVCNDLSLHSSSKPSQFYRKMDRQFRVDLAMGALLQATLSEDLIALRARAINKLVVYLIS
jgi:hypothetical protein